MFIKTKSITEQIQHCNLTVTHSSSHENKRNTRTYAQDKQEKHIEKTVGWSERDRCYRSTNETLLFSRLPLVSLIKQKRLTWRGGGIQLDNT